MDSLNDKFMIEISKVKEPEIFIGVARILKVKLIEDSGEVRDFVDLFNDVIASFAAAPLKRRKELLKILRDANKFKGEIEVNGNTTSDSQS